MKTTETVFSRFQNDDPEKETDVRTAIVGCEQRSDELIRGAAETERDGLPTAPRKRWVKMSLFQMPADGRAHIFLRKDEASIWDMGDANADLVGVALETASRAVSLRLNCFSFNRHELIFSSYASCDELRLDICVACATNEIRGYVDLPLGCSVTFQSGADRTSLIGFSSFCLGFLE